MNGSTLSRDPLGGHVSLATSGTLFAVQGVEDRPGIRVPR